MKTYNRDLKRAKRWLSSGRSSKVIRYLEPKVPLFLEDPDYYAILGRACLYSGLLKDADTYLNRGLQADPAHTDVRLVLAVNYLKRKDPASAVRAWLEVLEDHPDQRHANKGLKTLRKFSDQSQQDRFLVKFDPARFLPTLSSPWPMRILTLLLVLLAALTVFYFRDPIMSLVDSAPRSMPSRAGAEAFELKEGGSLTSENQDTLIVLQDREISRAMKRALDHYESYEDNAARHELNILLASNAEESIIIQAANLIDLLGETDIQTIETAFSYDDVVKEPWAYNGCFVLWKGKTANVVFAEERISFDFLVGFENEKVLKGRVPVSVPFLAVMEPLPLELLARVEAEGESFSLTAKTLHFIR